MKRILIVGLAVLGIAGCPGPETLLPFSIELPADGDAIVPGGITNLEPYLGKFKRYSDDKVMGDFLLGSCGCGDWRVLFRYSDGSQTQFPVAFYTGGDYQPTGAILAFGEPVTSTDSFSGTVDQDTGALTATARVGSLESSITATRTDIHGGGGSVQACIMCHIGDDPILPLPDDHPGNARRIEAGRDDVCLECHSANGQ